MAAAKRLSIRLVLGDNPAAVESSLNKFEILPDKKNMLDEDRVIRLSEAIDGSVFKAKIDSVTTAVTMATYAAYKSALREAEERDRPESEAK